MKRIEFPYNWSPRAYQKPVWDYLSGGGKRAVVCWPRRHGKDDVGLQHMACAMAERPGTYWYLLPEYAQARKAVWDPIDEERGVRRIDLIFPKAVRSLYREQEMMIGIGKSTLQILGADNYNSLVGSPPVGVGFSEYSRTDPSAWSYLMPILEKNGGWAYFNSTPFGDNHFKRFCEMADRRMRAGQDWFYQHLTADQCGVYQPAQLLDIRDQLIETHGPEYGEALFLQEYYCSFDAAMPGAIFGDQIDRARREGRIRPFAVDRSIPVYTGWDLGRVDATAIWWYQVINRELFFFDFHQSTMKDVPFYVEQLDEVRERYGIRYARHWLPHDARPRRVTEGAGSMLQQMTEAARRNPKLGAFGIGKALDKQEQIQAARKTLPLCVFHDTRCAEGLRALRHYHREYDTETKAFAATPVHDWSSHPADAFMTVAMTWHMEREPEPPPPDVQPSLALPTWGDMKKHFFARRREEQSRKALG